MRAAEDHRLLIRYLPEAGTVTREQYRRLSLPAPPSDRHRAVDPRRRVCAACGVPFTANSLAASRARFCGRDCRRWFHYGAGAKTRKRQAA